MSNGHLKVRVDALRLDIEGLLKLLGGNEADRLRFWEIVKGITTPAVFKVVDAQLEGAEAQIKSVTKAVNMLHANAKELSAGH